MTPPAPLNLPRRDGPPSRLAWAADLLWGSRARLAVTAAVAVGLLAGAFAARAYVRRERAIQRAQLAAAAWDKIRQAADRQESAAVHTGLDYIASLTPDDPSLARWRTTLQSGEADAADQTLVRFVLNEHLAADRLADAACEAGKRLAVKPRDWVAGCVVAHHALAGKRFDDVRDRLAALPSPFDADGGVGPGPLLYAFRLKAALGEPPPTDWSNYLVLSILPALESGLLSRATRAEKFQLLDAHAIAHDFLDAHPDLGRSWVPAATLGRMLLAEPQLSAAELQRLARQFERQWGALANLEQRGRFAADETGRLRTELADRTAAAWRRLRATEPADPASYLGLAASELRAKRPAAARAVLDDGVKACGPRPELLAGLAQAVRADNPAAGVELMIRAVRQRPDEAGLWQGLADVAFEAGRPDLAAGAAEEAVRLRPELYWPRLAAARAQLTQGRPTAAAGVLAAAKPALVRDPVGAALYVRALCEAGAAPLVDDFLTEAEATAKPAAVLAAGASELVRAGRTDAALRWAQRATRHDPESRPARRAAADALRAQAEAAAPPWDAGRVGVAVRAYEWLLQRDPADLAAANYVAWLQLKGLGDVAAATRSVAPLAAREADLAPDMAETLGAVLLAAGKPAEAVRVLERAAAARPPRPGVLTQLALAYLAVDRRIDAEAALLKASPLPKSDREATEFRAASAQVQAPPRPVGR